MTETTGTTETLDTDPAPSGWLYAFFCARLMQRWATESFGLSIWRPCFSVPVEDVRHVAALLDAAEREAELIAALLSAPGFSDAAPPEQPA